MTPRLPALFLVLTRRDTRKEREHTSTERVLCIQQSCIIHTACIFQCRAFISECIERHFQCINQFAVTVY